MVSVVLLMEMVVRDNLVLVTFFILRSVIQNRYIYYEEITNAGT